MARWRALNEDTGDLVEAARQISRPLENNEDLDALIEQIGDARFVLLGEASHGTSYTRKKNRVSPKRSHGDCS